MHALKSSAMIIGAKELGEKARRLENAGKQNDAAYIKKNHKEFVSLFLSFKEILKDVSEGS